MVSWLSRHAATVLVALVVSGLLVWGFWPQPVLVEAATVDRGPMVVTVEEEGQTRLMDRYVISAPVAGVACRVQLEVGDAVSAGQVLLHISPLESGVLDPRSEALADARLAAARAAHALAGQQAEAAQARAEFQRAELERLTPMMDRGVVSKAEFDRARMEQRTAEASLASARQAVAVARYEEQAAETALKYTAGTVAEPASQRVPVRSPIDGRVLAITHECEGAVVTGQPLLVVGDPRRLEVVVDLLSSDAVRVRPGMAVRFRGWGGDAPLEGRVRTVEPLGVTRVSALGVEEQRVNVVADFLSPQTEWQRLGDGYRVDAVFTVWSSAQALKVPASSLFRRADGWAVFVIDDGRAALRPVEVGQRTGVVAEVVGGLAEGEAVILRPPDALVDGARVRVR